MKYLKMLVLTAVAALAAMAIVGATSASAVVLCKENKTPCPEAAQYPSGTKISAKLVAGTKAVLKGSLTVECSVSTVSGETTAKSGSPLPGKITGLTFSTCTTCPTVTAESLPYTVSGNATGGGNGTMTVSNPKVKLAGCFGFANCTASAASVTLDLVGGSPGRVKAVNEPLTISGFGCGTSGTWNAEYEITAPNPVFITT